MLFEDLAKFFFHIQGQKDSENNSVHHLYTNQSYYDQTQFLEYLGDKVPLTHISPSYQNYHERLTAAAPAADACLVISNEEMKDIMKIVKSLKHSGLLIKMLVKQLKMKQKNKKVDFLTY